MPAGAENTLAFQAEQLGTYTMEAKRIGSSLRDQFEGMDRMIRKMAEGGIKINPVQIAFDDEVDQAAWSKYVELNFEPTEQAHEPRFADDPPMMPLDQERLQVVT